MDRSDIRNTKGAVVMPLGVFVNAHEKIAADFLAAKTGCRVTFLVPDRRKGAKTPDIKMNGMLWEIKSPRGKSSRTIENNLRLALQQSPNVVLDLRRMDGRIPTKKLLAEAERRFIDAKMMKNLIVITRHNKFVDFRR